MTGSRQIGKTTLLAELLGGEKLPGLQSKAVFSGAPHPDRVELLETTTGRKTVVGHYENGSMQVQPEGFEAFGVQCIHTAATASSEWVQIDELGFLERDCAAFADAVERLFEQKRVVAVLRKQQGIPLNDALLARPDVFVFDLDELIPPDSLQIGCVILAAGEARRFGANKLLAEFQGRPMLEQSFLRLPARLWSSTLVVTCNKEVAELAAAYGLPTIMPEGAQLSDSIRCAAKSLKGLDGVLFSVGDQPLCRAESLQLILRDFVAHPSAIVRLSFEDWQGNPVIFPGDMLLELEELTSEQGGNTVIRRHTERLRSVQALFAEELEDADTPQKLNALRQIPRE